MATRAALRMIRNDRRLVLRLLMAAAFADSAAAAKPPAPKAETIALDVAAPPELARTLLPRLLSGFLAAEGRTTKPDPTPSATLKLHFETAVGRQAIVINTTSSAGAIAALAAHAADIAFPDRPPTNAERALLVRAVPLDYADAGFVPVVHPANPLSRLARTQVAAILDDSITNWSRLGRPAAPLHAYVPQDLATTAAMGYGIGAAQLPFGHTLTVLPDEAAVARAVAADRHGIGFITGGPAAGVRAVRLEAAAQAALVRTLSAYAAPDAKPLAARFLAYLQTDDAGLITTRAGFTARPAALGAAPPPPPKTPPPKPAAAQPSTPEPTAPKVEAPHPIADAAGAAKVLPLAALSVKPPAPAEAAKPVAAKAQAAPKPPTPTPVARLDAAQPATAAQTAPQKPAATPAQPAPAQSPAAPSPPAPSAPVQANMTPDTPHPRIVHLPENLKFTFGPLKDVRLPMAPPRMIFMPAHADATKPTQGSMQVDCAIDTAGVPQDCKLVSSANSGDVSGSILSWLSSGAIRYPAKDANGQTGGRRTLTVKFPGQ